MKFITALFASLAMLVMMQTASANNSKPTICPLPIAIKTAPVAFVKPTNDGRWGLAIKSKFATNYDWAFALFKIEANDEKEALVKGKIILSTLKYVAGPIQSDSKNSWSCFYVTATGYPAIAATGLM